LTNFFVCGIIFAVMFFVSFAEKLIDSQKITNELSEEAPGKGFDEQS
jgi:hypothetical protein